MPKPPAAWRRLPKLVRFLMCHAAIGFVVATVFVGALVMMDPQDIGTLMLGAAGHWWPVLALWFFSGLTFGAVQMGAATMLLADAPPPRPRGGSGAPAGLVPIRVPVRRG